MKKIIKNQTVMFFQVLGGSVCSALIVIFYGIRSFFSTLGSVIWRGTKGFRKKAFYIFQYLFVFIVSPFVKLSSSFSKMKSDISKAKREKGSAASLKAFLPHLFAFIFGKRGVAVTVFNHAAPVVSVIFLLNVVSYATSINYAVKLNVNGQFLGYVENEQVFYDAEMIVEQRLNSLGSSKNLETSPLFAVENAGYSEMLSAIQIADLLLKDSGINVDYAYGVIINGTMHGAVLDNTDIKKTLENLLDVHRTGASDEEVKFVWNIECEQSGLYPTDSIIDPQIIIKDITELNSRAQYYTVQLGDSHSLIGDYLNMTQAQIETLNPGFIGSDLHVGDKIMYSADVPALPVSVTRTEVYEEIISYSTEYIDTDTYFEGTRNIQQQGENGLRTVTARVSVISGEEANREVINQVLNYQPVTEIVYRGTKPLPRNTVSTDTASFGKFIWPISRGSGKISELTWRDGGYYGHTGVDFSAPYGTPIYAGGSGTVVFAGWNYGYGKCVIIQHPNGLKTYYAHCSSIEVSVGEEVLQGQCVGLVGQTGTAYGNHVHFEVRQGGSILNPMDFID